MPRAEEVHHGDVLVGDQVDLQVAHEPRRGHPEVVADHDDRLDAPAVAMPQRGDELGLLIAPAGEEPLLELVEDQQHLLTGTEPPPAPQRGQGVDQSESGAQLGARLAKAAQQPGLGLLGRRLDVDRQHLPGQPRQEPRLDQRRLAAARGAVDQPHLEGGVGIGRFDPRLPEPQALGQAVSVAGVGEQFEEEIGVVAIERPQALGDDLDGRCARVRMHGAGTGGVASWVEPCGGKTGPGPFAEGPGATSPWRNCRKSSARSRAVLYRSAARLASIRWQIRSSSRGIASSICRGGRSSARWI